MEYIESPENFVKTYDSKALFLAGGITNCPDWQSEIVDLLRSSDIAILNPRRKKFSIDNQGASKEQIRWEFEHLRISDMILFWFPKESICPIALYELGAWCMTDNPLLIGVERQYERKIDIEEQTALIRPGIKIVYSLNDLAGQVMDYLERE